MSQISCNNIFILVIIICVHDNVGQHDKEWSALIMPLADQKEKWWVTVMDVGLDPVRTCHF